jgi:putative membrane protein
MLKASLTGLPAFLVYFGAALCLVGAYAAVYIRITPHREFELIRQGNASAITAFLGTLLGFALPVASASAHSVSFLDFVIWAAIAGIAQSAAFLIARLSLPMLSTRIAAGEIGAGLWLGGLSLIVGLLNAASMVS